MEMRVQKILVGTLAILICIGVLVWPEPVSKSAAENVASVWLRYLRIARSSWAPFKLDSPRSIVQSPSSKVQSPRSKIQSQWSKSDSPFSNVPPSRTTMISTLPALEYRLILAFGHRLLTKLSFSLRDLAPWTMDFGLPKTDLSPH